MNLHSSRPDRSPEAVAKRKWAADQARAMNIHQGYEHDPILEEANERFVAGDITSEEFLREMIASIAKR